MFYFFYFFFCKISLFTHNRDPRLQKKEGEGISKFEQCQYLNCFFLQMASLTHELRECVLPNFALQS